MSEPPLKLLADYSRFVAETLDRPDVQRSTVAVWSDGPYGVLHYLERSELPWKS